jgi:hypothetical protein
MERASGMFCRRCPCRPSFARSASSRNWARDTLTSSLLRSVSHLSRSCGPTACEPCHACAVFSCHPTWNCQAHPARCQRVDSSFPAQYSRAQQATPAVSAGRPQRQALQAWGGNSRHAPRRRRCAEAPPRSQQCGKGARSYGYAACALRSCPGSSTRLRFTTNTALTQLTCVRGTYVGGGADIALPGPGHGVCARRQPHAVRDAQVEGDGVSGGARRLGAVERGGWGEGVGVTDGALRRPPPGLPAEPSRAGLPPRM